MAEDSVDIIRVVYHLFGKWAKTIAWLLAILAILGLILGAISKIKPALESIDFVLIRINESPDLALLLLVVYLVVILSVIGLMVGLLIRIGFATPINRRIDNMLEGIVDMLKDISYSIADDKDIKTLNQLSHDAEELRNNWRSSLIMKFINWDMPKLKTRLKDK